MSRQKSSTGPPSDRIEPMFIQSNVLLPDPDAPIMTIVSPRCTNEIDPVKHVTTLKALHQVTHLNHVLTVGL